MYMFDMLFVCGIQMIMLIMLCKFKLGELCGVLLFDFVSFDVVVLLKVLLCISLLMLIEVDVVSIDLVDFV